MQLSDVQRDKLCEMTNVAFVEIRQLAQDGRLEQAFDLASAFHNLLDDLWGEDFKLEEFRETCLVGYQQKYPEPANRNYLVLVDQIIKLGKSGPAVS